MALELELKLYLLMNSMLDSMVEDLTEEQLQQQIGEGNPPSWILGHLAIGNDFGVASLGGTPELLETFLPVFGPGSPPTGDHPPKAELVQLYQGSKQRFVSAVENADPGQLQKDRDSEILKESLPKVVDMVAHLLTTHMGLHLGQLSAWRRINGLPSILRIG